MVLDGRPEIFPVNHVVDHGTVVLRTGQGSKMLGAVGRPVAFEADHRDADAGTAWSVVVKGQAREVRRLHELIDAIDLPLQPWFLGTQPRYLRIEVDEISGRRLAAPEPDPDTAGPRHASQE